MADQTVTLRITANTQGLVTGVELAKRETRSLGDEGQIAGQKLGSGVASARTEIERTGTLINQVKGFVGGLAAAFVSVQSVRALASMADEWSDLTSLVKVNIGATEDANAVMERLTRVARGTYSSLRDTAQSFAANAITLNALGKSTQEQLEYTTALNNALVISGAKGDQFAQVQDALSKAMATGSLRGQELNTVLGRGSAVAEALAAELGTSALELRQLGADGKITGDVIFTALVRRMKELEERAESMPATIGDAFTVFRNALLSTVGYADNAAGATNGIAEAIIDLADVISRPEVKEGFAAIAIGAVNAAAEVAKLFGEVKKLADFGGRLAAMKVTGWLDPDDLELLKVKAADYSNELLRLKNNERSWTAVTRQQRQERIAFLTEEIAKLQDSIKAAQKKENAVAVAAQAAEDASKKAAEEAERQRQASLDALRALVAGSGDAEDATRSLADAQADLYTHLTRITDATDDVDAMIRRYTRTLASDATRAQMDYQDNLAEILNLELQWMALGPLSEAQIAKLNEARALAGQMYRRDIEDLNAETVRAAERAAEEATRAWERFTYDLADAVLDGSAGVKRWWKQMIDDMKRQLIQSGLMSLFGSLFNMGGGAGGGLMSMFGGMMGNGSGGFGGGFLGQLGTMFGSNAMGAAGRSFGAGIGQAVPWLAAAGGALHGYRSSGIGAAVGYGVGGYAVGTVAAYGLAGAAGAAGMGGAAMGAGAAGGAMMGAAAVPVIGWIIAAIAALDMLTGGKVFGTKYRPESTSQTLGIGADGAYAEAERTDVRQRSLFRGRKWNTYAIDAGDDARASADALYSSIFDTMTSAARSLAIDVPPVIDAAIRTVTEYDKKGRITGLKIFTDALGRTWSEAISDPEDEAEIQAAAARAASRIQSEAIIAVIDAALGTTVQRAGSGTSPGGPGLGGGGIGPGRGIEDMLAPLGLGDVVSLDPILGPIADEIEAGANRIGEAFSIAERWRHDAELLAEGAQFLLLAATDIRRGSGLLADEGGLTAITALIEDLAASGETLSDTYVRVATSAALLDQALSLSGVAIEGTREHVVRLATAITDAAGGLEAAQALWQSYFTNFYDAAELAQYNAAQLRTAAAAAFAGAGLDLSQYLDVGGMERFRAAFEAAMPTMSAEDIAAWLRAADALAAVTASARQIDAALDDNAWQLHLDALDDNARAVAELARQYDDMQASLLANAASAEQLATLEDQRALAMGRLLAAQAEQAAREQAEAEAARAAALGEYTAFITAVWRETQNLSAYRTAVLNAEDWRTQAIATANQHARAAGLAAASEQALAVIELRASQMRAVALAQLREETQSLVDQLYGSSGASLGDAVSAGLDSASNAASDYWEQQRRAAVTLRDYLDSMLLGDLSALTPAEQLAEAWSQLNAAVADGDADAATRLADVYLRMLRGHEASGEDYSAGFWNVREMLQGMLDNIGSIPGAVSGDTGSSSYITAAQAEGIAATNRLELAAQLARHLADLSGAVGQTVYELMESMGVDLRTLATDLGISLQAITGETVLSLVNMADLLGSNLTELTGQMGLSLTDLGSGIRELAEQTGVNLDALTAESAAALGGLANQLGLDLAALAGSVGVDLGSLADAQSLLNQALAAQIDLLPTEQRDALAPHLAAIAAATTAADANSAIDQMASYINTLAPDIRNALAPYFASVFPADALSDLDYLTSIDTSTAAMASAMDTVTVLLDRIAANAAAANNAANIPSYAVGTWNVPQTGPAILHAGEMVLPVPMARAWREGDIGGGGSGGDTRALEARLDRVIERLDRLDRTTAVAGQQVSGAVVKAAADSDRNNDQSRARHVDAQRRGVTA